MTFSASKNVLLKYLIKVWEFSAQMEIFPERKANSLKSNCLMQRVSRDEEGKVTSNLFFLCLFKAVGVFSIYKLKSPGIWYVKGQNFKFLQNKVVSFQLWIGIFRLVICFISFSFEVVLKPQHRRFVIQVQII